jgi:hypothetical protein
VRATLKLEPSLLIPEGTANGWALAFSIVIACALAWVRSTLWPFCVADAALNDTELNWSSGRTPFAPDGASSIHSADDSDDA